MTDILTRAPEGDMKGKVQELSGTEDGMHFPANSTVHTVGT